MCTKVDGSIQSQQKQESEALKCCMYYNYFYVDVCTPYIVPLPSQKVKRRHYEETSTYSVLRWLNTVLAVCEYTCMSFAKSWQEKGCSSQAETWQVKNILTILQFPWQHVRLNTTFKFHFCSVDIKFGHQIFL